MSKESVKHYVRRVKAFIVNRASVTDRDVQAYIQAKKEVCKPDYVSNIISSFKAYFRDYKGLSFMDSYKHPSSPLGIKEEIEPWKVKAFIEAIDELDVQCVALFRAHYNEEAKLFLENCEKSNPELRNNERLLATPYERFFYTWKRAKEKSGVNLKPKDMRDYFTQEMGKALIPDRYIDIFQGRAPRNVLAKHYTTQGIKTLREVYDKANLNILLNSADCKHRKV